MAVTRARDLLDEAWELRFRQRNREARALLDKVDALHGSLSGSMSSETFLDAELLRVSLLRAEGELDESNALLERLTPQVKSDRSKIPFQFFLQKALNLFKADDFAVALEYFLMADREAPSPVQRVVCLINVLTCLDNLGLPWSGVLEELERELPKARRTRSAFVDVVEDLLRIVRFGDEYRSMHIDRMFSESLPEEFDQAEYLRLYVSRLPYVTTRWKPDASLEQLARTDSFHLKAYRLATLGFSPESKRVAGVETSQQVDRLYLWTWAWLKEPTEKRRRDLAAAIEALDFATALKRMTWEDTQMMRNALGWISIFQPKLAPWISKYVESIPKSELPLFPVFALEKEWIEALRRNDSKVIAKLSKNKTKGIDFLGALGPARASLASMRTPPPRAAVIVDERKNEIAKGKTRVQSEALVRIIRELDERLSLEFSEVLWLGFEIAPYDDAIHVPKIYNLIARLKTLLPQGAKLSTKNGVLHLTGSLRGLEFVAAAPHERPIVTTAGFASKPVPQPVRNARPVHPRQLLATEMKRVEWKREELQNLLGTSKAGTQRWIQKWESQGFIRREGAGKSSVYRIEISQHLRLSDSV